MLSLAAAPVTARDLAGRYRATEGPDVAAQLELRRDGRFAYTLAAGALDEWAEGRWERRRGPAGEQACLTTEPAPVPPAFEPAPAPPEQVATIRVAWPSGRGIPGVNFVIGFDSGEPIEDYTQADGWTLPASEQRVPRWIELVEPIHRVILPRTSFPTGGRFYAVLRANDLGVVAFADACLEAVAGGFVLHRREGDMKFRKAER